MPSNVANTQARGYHLQNVQTIARRFTFADRDVNGDVLLGTLPAGSLIKCIDVLIETAFAGGTPTVDVRQAGSGSADIVTDVTIAATATGNKPNLASVLAARLTADRGIVARLSAGLTAGVGIIVVEYIPNIN